MTTEVTLNREPTKTHTANAIVRHLPAVVRVLLGLLFFVSGLNGFLNFLPQPSAPLPPGPVAFINPHVKTGYMLPLISATQLIVGVLLLSNRFVPLALALLAPFMVNSIAFHVFLEPSGRPMAFIVLALQLYLVWVYRESYRSMLTARVQPV